MVLEADMGHGRPETYGALPQSQAMQRDWEPFLQEHTPGPFKPPICLGIPCDFLGRGDDQSMGDDQGRSTYINSS